MAYTTIASSTVSPISTPSQKPLSKATFETRLKAALEHARRLTEMHGLRSIDAAIAWETVEELQTAKAHQQQVSPTTAFARYCAENPHAPESRMYDV
ncbi:Calvin cycle protein CP12 [Leptothoe sp. LEGE 181152]|nr:Calvin cycle protein CP12 [Leptothoe sp. LEGE 181152]